MSEHDTTESTGTPSGPDAGPSAETNIIEKAFLMGLGAAFLAKDKAEELADELVKRGTMTRDESGSFVGKVTTQAHDTTASARKTVSEETAKVADGLGLVSKKDFERLEAEMAEIKALIASLKPQGPAGGDS